MPEEVREYRDRLYTQNKQARIIAQHANSSEATELAPLTDLSDYEIVRQTFSDEFCLFLGRGVFPLG